MVLIGVVVIGHAVELHFFHGVEIHSGGFHHRFAALVAGQLVFAVGVGETRQRIRLEIIERVALVVDHTGGVGDMQMAGKRIVDAPRGELFRRVHIVVEHERIGDGRLHLHVRRERMMDHQKRRVAVFFALIRPIVDPLRKVGSDGAGGLFGFRLAEGILARIHDDQTEVVVKIRHIRQAAGLLLLVGRIAVRRTFPAFRRHSVVIAEVAVNVEKLFIGDGRRRLFFVVFKREAVRRVDVVVAVDHEDFGAALFFKILQQLCKRLMRNKLRVLGQIAGQQQIFDALLFGVDRCGFERRADDRFRFVEHLAVKPADIQPVLCAVALFAVGEDVQIAHRIKRQRGLHGLVARFGSGKKLHRAEQHQHRKQNGQQFLHLFHAKHLRESIGNMFRLYHKPPGKKSLFPLSALFVRICRNGASFFVYLRPVPRFFAQKHRQNLRQNLQ